MDAGEAFNPEGIEAVRVDIQGAALRVPAASASAANYPNYGNVIPGFAG